MSNMLITREVTSAPVIIQHGVPRGLVVGPLLFNVYLLRIFSIAIRSAIICMQTTLSCTLSVRHRVTQMHNENPRKA